MSSAYTPLILSILPEILLLILAMVVLIVDLVIKPAARRNLGWVTAVGIALIMLLSFWLAQPPQQGEMVWGSMMRWDMMGFAFTILFLFGAAITALIGMDVEGLGDRGEFYLLLIASTIGMGFLAGASDLIMVYIALETVAIPLYVLSGILGKDNRSVEAGFKYLLFGAMASAILLYGFSLLYGFTNTTDLYQISESLSAGQVPIWGIIGSLVLILVGFGFKISAVPLHFWAPDVYEGAPTPISGFLSTASKAAGFLILMRVLFVVFPSITLQWSSLIAAIAVATMTIGNLLALAQKNIKRMLAYSSIAHAGYALIGIATMSGLGLTSTIFYLIAYLITNLAAFGVVTAYGNVIHSDEIKDYAGMSRRAPGLAMIMLVAFLSLAGMPPLAGFIAKFMVFAAAIQAGQIWLATVGIINSIIGLYYYLVVLKVVYLYRSENDDQPAKMSPAITIALVILVVGILLVGTAFSPIFVWSFTAASGMF
jgi:NADH-quinone oxidoreductase subunit N